MSPVLSQLAGPAWLPLCHLAAGYLDEPAPQPWLWWMNLAGFGIALTALGWWIARSRRDPLAGAPGRPNTLQPESVMLAVLAYLGASLLLFVALGGWPGEPDNATASSEAGSQDVLRGVLVGNGAGVVGVLACLAIAARRFEGGLRRFWLGNARFRRGLLQVLVLTLVAGTVCELLMLVTHVAIRFLVPEYDFPEHTVIEVLRDEAHGPGLVILAWVGAGVIAPIAEEAFFRGILQTFLVGWLRSRWLAIGVAALAFALVHSELHTMPALAVLALVLGAVYERTGSLWVPILVHALFNLKTLVGITLLEMGY